MRSCLKQAWLRRRASKEVKASVEGEDSMRQLPATPETTRARRGSSGLRDRCTTLAPGKSLISWKASRRKLLVMMALAQATWFWKAPIRSAPCSSPSSTFSAQWVTASLSVRCRSNVISSSLKQAYSEVELSVATPKICRHSSMLCRLIENSRRSGTSENSSNRSACSVALASRHLLASWTANRTSRVARTTATVSFFPSCTALSTSYTNLAESADASNLRRRHAWADIQRLRCGDVGSHYLAIWHSLWAWMERPPHLNPPATAACDASAAAIARSAVYALSTLPDGRIVAGRADGSLAVCPHSAILDRISGQTTSSSVERVAALASPVLALQPVGESRVACGHDTGVAVVDLAAPGSPVSIEIPLKAGRRRASPGLPEVLDLGWRDGDATLIASAGDGRALGCDLRSRSLAFQLSAHRGACTCLALPSGHTELATGGADGTVAMWELRMNRERMRLQPPAATCVNTLVWEDGTHAVVCAGTAKGGTGFASRYSSFGNGLALGTVDTSSPVQAGALSSDSLLLASLDGTLAVVGEADEPLARTATGLRAAHCLTHDPAAEVTVVAGRGRDLAVFTGDTYAVACRIALPDGAAA